MLATVVGFALCFLIKGKCLFFVALGFPVVALILAIVHFFWLEGFYAYFAQNPLIRMFTATGMIILAAILRSQLLKSTPALPNQAPQYQALHHQNIQPNYY